MLLRNLILTVLTAGRLGAADLRVVTWNIEHGASLDSIAATLAAEEPDLVLLQEVDRHTRRTGFRDVAADLAARLGLQLSYGKAFDELGQTGGAGAPEQGQATLSREVPSRSRVTVFANQTGFWKPRAFLPQWAILQRRTGGRIALVTEFGEGSRRLTVVNVHIESETRDMGHVGRAQIGELLGALAAIPPDRPLILAGDFNSFYRPGRLRSRMAAAGFRSALASPERTHRIHGSLDWIFVRGPLSIASARVVREAKASDHRPVSAQLQYSVKQNTVLDPSGESPYSPFSRESYTSRR